jgi:predicted RNase H-like HicB family nuclease
VAKQAILTPIYEEVEDGWIQGRIAEIPAVITAGRDRAEAEFMLRDALREYLDFLIAEGEPLPDAVTPDAEI